MKTAAILLFVGVLGGGAMLWVMTHQGTGRETTDVIIPRKASLAQVSRILEQNGIIQHPDLFKLLMRVTRGSTKVRAGEFRFGKDSRMVDALYVLYYSEPIVHQVTVPEGWNLRQIAQILSAAGLIDEQKFLKLTLSKQGAQKYRIQAPTLEGFLFPDTYAFSKIDGEDRIVDIMVQSLVKRWAKDYKADADAAGMSFEKTITLASVIEKETGAPNERPLVSSVFHNRLRKHMPLQSDPTTIYGIENFNGNLTKADLQRYTPYNTYTIPALPPGPIASPGDASIRAAIHPAASDYLYFVSNNQGSHIFSKTYSQHARQVTTWQKEYFSKRLGKAPKKN